MNPIKSYYKPTPVLWRKIGDALLIVSTSVTMYGISSHQDLLAIIACISGTVGKVITNIAKEE